MSRAFREMRIVDANLTQALESYKPDCVDLLLPEDSDLLVRLADVLTWILLPADDRVPASSDHHRRAMTWPDPA